MFRRVRGATGVAAILVLAVVCGTATAAVARVSAQGDDLNALSRPASKAPYKPSADVTASLTALLDAQRIGVSLYPDGSEFGASVAISGISAAIGGPSAAPYDYEVGQYVAVGSAAYYEKLNDRWTLRATFKGEDANDYFGQSVAVEPGFIAIGTPGDDLPGTDAGSVAVYTYADSTWTARPLLRAADGAAGAEFGFSVALSGDTLVVGAPGDSSDRGAAYVFVRDGSGVWTQQAKLQASDGVAGDWFGWEVSIDGDSIAVGATRQDGAGADAGAAYVFTRTAGSWNQQAKVTASDAQANDHFGNSVSIDGGLLGVGANADDDLAANAGAAYVFGRSGVAWTQQAKLRAAGGAAEDYFGASVSVEGERIAVGAPFVDTYKGADVGCAYVFGVEGGAWVQQLAVTLPLSVPDDWFGYSVSMSARDIAVGAPYAWDSDQYNYTGSGFVLTVSEPYTAVYRFYNPRLGTHFYTATESERDSVRANLGNTYTYEGVGYTLNPKNNPVPLYRFYNRLVGVHFYTANEQERANVIANLGHIYTYEGVAYGVSGDPAAGRTAYRFFRPSTGTHFYTADAGERDRVMSTLGAIYAYEGPAFYLAQ